jgi:hypothetical protein
VTGGTHQARVVRRVRHGAYGSWAICQCGWEREAWNYRNADELVGQHNRTPNEEAS